jgi:hypothetical protein
VAALVVGWDCDVDEFGGRVCVAKGNDGDVDIGGFFDGLSIGSWIGDNDQSRFFERAGDVVGEVSGSEATCNGDGAGVGSEFEDSALAIGTCGDDTDVGWVVDCGDNASSENDLLPVIVDSSQSMFRRRRKWPEWRGSAVFLGYAYQVFPMLITLIPSGRVFHRYGSMCTCRFFDPR